MKKFKLDSAEEKSSEIESLAAEQSQSETQIGKDKRKRPESQCSVYDLKYP